MMIDSILLLIIVSCLLYAFYDQFLINRLNGETRLAVPLKQQGLDGWILLGLIILTAIQGITDGIESLTLFLLAGCILLALYAALLRQPYWLFKAKGFYLSGLFIDYHKIKAINQAEFKGSLVFVIDLNNGKRLFARLKMQNDNEKVIRFLAELGEIK